MFENFNDAVGIEKLCKMLNIGKNLAYRMVLEKKINAKKIGRSWIIAKCDVVDYLTRKES